MKIKPILLQTIIYLFIISSGLQMGAATYETVVVTPLWAVGTPESVIGWNPVPQYAIMPGSYWRYGTVAYGLLGLLMAAAAWFMPRRARYLSLASGLIAVLIVVITGVYFVPILMKLIVAHGAGYTGEQITDMANGWVRWNWLRFAAGLTAWTTAIVALCRAQPQTVTEQI